MRRKTPQLKKAESYRKDRRNTYGENAKASRKAVRRKKRRQARAERRIAHAAYTTGATPDLDRIDESEARALRKHRKVWKLKLPDEPLGAVVAKKLARRASAGMIDPARAESDARKIRRTSGGKSRGK